MVTARVMHDALAAAKTKAARARAHYAFALFHDRNGREAQAIPHYQAALKLGLPREIASRANAFLASSLWKTSKPRRALASAHEARDMTRDAAFRHWVERLVTRIGRSR